MNASAPVDKIRDGDVKRDAPSGGAIGATDVKRPASADAGFSFTVTTHTSATLDTLANDEKEPQNKIPIWGKYRHIDVSHMSDVLAVERVIGWGYRVLEPDLYPPNELELLRKVLTSREQPSVNEDRLANIIRKLYATSDYLNLVAHYQFGSNAQAQKELHTARNRIQTLEQAAVEFGTRHKSVMEMVMKQAQEVRATMTFQDKQRKENELTMARWSREMDGQRKELDTLSKRNGNFMVRVQQ